MHVQTKKLWLVSLVTLLILVGVLIWWRVGHKAAQSQTDTVITTSIDKPSEELPEKVGYVWKGGPEDPKKLRISKINVDAYVQKVGVDQNRQVSVPNNIHITGWFTQSVKPGEAGLAIIDGHLDGYKNDGVFILLQDLAEGDTFSLERGDGKTLRYQVISAKQLATAEAAAELFSQDPRVKSQLNLITCGGNFDQSKRSYDKRVIVSAQLID